MCEPPSWAGGFHLTVITSGSSVGDATTKYGFPGADGGPEKKIQITEHRLIDRERERKGDEI